METERKGRSQFVCLLLFSISQMVEEIMAWITSFMSFKVLFEVGLGLGALTKSFTSLNGRLARAQSC